MKAAKNKGLTAWPKQLAVIDELQCDCVSTKNDQSNKETLFRPLTVTIIHSMSVNLSGNSGLVIWVTELL